MGEWHDKRAGRRTRTVSEDWLAWIPPEMGRLFDAARKELDTSSLMLSMTIDEALQLCKDGEWQSANDRATMFAGLFDRLATRVAHVIGAIREHGSHFGTLPNVEPLSSLNFRGSTAQRIARTNNMLAKVVFAQRSRFFHKLYSIDAIVGGLQQEIRAALVEMADEEPQGDAWQLLEVLCYDISTCMEEAKILLKSFFCALPSEELGAFREKLASRDSTPLGFDPDGVPSV